MRKYMISDVAKKFDITRTALIHYDKCGILSPSMRNEKNYRFYTDDDLLKLELILALKESGLSLKEIQSYLSEEIDSTIIELLKRQKQEIAKKIDALKSQSDIIERRIETLSKFYSITIYEGFRMNKYPPVEIVKEPIGFGPLMGFDSAVQRLRGRLQKGAHISSKFGICFSIRDRNSSVSYEMKYVFDYLSSDSTSSKSSYIDGGNYLRCIHQGNYTSVDRTINSIISHAHENGLDICGDAFFVPLFDHWESLSDEFMGEVLVPVRVKNKK